MTSIRINPASLSAFSKLDSASYTVPCSGHNCPAAAAAAAAATSTNEDVAGAGERKGIDIPKSNGGRVRRVSFNLRDTTVLQLPSNTVISKIANARNRRSSSLTLDVNKLEADAADRQAQALLPHGASPELLDPGFSMTSLYVKRGHIHSLDHHYSVGGSGSMDDSGQNAAGLPVKGVLKPFMPSPVDTKLLMNGLPGQLDELDDDSGSGNSSDDDEGSDSSDGDDSTAPSPTTAGAASVAHGGSGGRRTKSKARQNGSGKKRRSKQQQHQNANLKQQQTEHLQPPLHPIPIPANV
ncbi:hypothetical protein GQ54DRAFT_95599 [Martensiomyces pterosporus]|nr:hypothetical protein GQ54DRAFT_95599 [Martensiomyces pterosporus]